MIKFTQHEIDLIGRKIFGKENPEIFDYTVFEFSKYYQRHNIFKTGSINIIVGQIYRINNPEEYYDIELHFDSSTDYSIYIRISFSNECNYYEMNLKTGEITEAGII